MFSRFHAIFVTAALALCGAASAAEVNGISTGFVQPLAPRQSAMPNKKLPSLGRDKWGLPFYHPRQTNRIVRTTAYTHTESDHVVYGHGNAAGSTLQYTDKVRSAAADWSVYPMGTKFRIKGQPYIYVVDDYGSALVGTGTIDIYQPSRELMRAWGRRIVEIEVIEWGSSARSLETLTARKGYKHCKQMYAALQEQQRHKGAN